MNKKIRGGEGVEKERNILIKAEEVMGLLKSLTFRERKAVLKILTDLIDADTWLVQHKINLQNRRLTILTYYL